MASSRSAAPEPSSVIATVGDSQVDDLMSDGEFELLRRLVETESGIVVDERKKAFLVRRLSKRLKSLGLNNFAQYYRRLGNEGGGSELRQMLDVVTTNETRFFREPRQFDYLENEIVPRWQAEANAGQRVRHVRVWSASCSSGEEPYSVAMCLAQHLQSPWLIRVEATDLSETALEKARRARYSMNRLSEIPDRYVRPFLQRGRKENDGLFCIGPEIRTLVEFRWINLIHEPYPVSGQFDLILCRNTLMYFNDATTASVVRRLVQRLRPGGYFLLGHAEGMAGRAPGMEAVAGSIFRRFS